MKQLKLTVFLVSLLGVFTESCEFEEINYRRPVPVALEASEISSSGFLAAWKPIEGGESYVVLVSDSDSFEEGSLLEGYPKTTTKTSLWVGQLAAGQTYYYAIKTDNNPDTEYSNVIVVPTLPLAAPQVLDPADITPLSFVAQWQPVEEVQYLLYVSTDINFTEHLDGYNGKLVSDTSVLVANLRVNEDYFYRVKAVRGESVSQASDVIRVSTSRLAKPALLSTLEINYTSITINWEEVEGATAYQVFVSTDKTVVIDVLPNYDPWEVTDATSLVVVGLNANTTYYYRVQAKNDLSESEKSEVGSVRTVSLDAPVARAASNVQIDGFWANWDSVANASSYVLDVARDENFTNFLNGYRAKEVVDTTEVINGLLRNTQYYYRVRAKGFGSVSNNSEVITVRTVSFASPRALEAVDLQTTSFRAVWQSVDNADAYELDVATDANFDNILPDYQNLEVNDTIQQVTGLTVNNRYFYRVRALKGSIASGYSNIIDLTTTSLSEPGLLASSDVQLTSFTINWQPVAGATRYRVDVGFDPLVENKIATDYNNRLVNGTSLSVMGLDANTTYYFKVRAENNLSTSGSSTGSAKTASINPPVVADPSDVRLTQFQANWSSVTDATSYLLDVATDDEFRNPVVSNLEVFDTFEVVTGLEPSRLYRYRVRAKGLGSTSDYSNTETAKTAPLPPPIVRNATDQEVYQFTAHWDAAEGADKYLLYVATDPAFSNILPNYDGKEVLGTSHIVGEIDPYTTYYYRLQSKQSTTVSQFSPTYATVDACLGGCQLVRREFTGWRRETYTYDANGLITEIELYDVANSKTIRTCRDFVYANGRVQSVRVDSTSGSDRVWQFIYEDPGDGERIQQITITEDVAADPEVGTIDFAYDNTSGDLIQLTYSGAGIAPGIEKYVYSNNLIKVTDSNNAPVKDITTQAEFNTESLLPSDMALLLFSPTNPLGRPLPFVLKATPTYYYYHSDDTGYPQVYEYNNKRVPQRIYPTSNGVPELRYTFDNCNF